MPKPSIDILEDTLRQQGDLLDILLSDKTTGKNIIWATDSYAKYGKGFRLQDQIRPELVTGQYGKLIQPRASKSNAEQKRRTKDKAEVFTPLKIVDEMNTALDQAANQNLGTNQGWQDYVAELKLEITCGEAPFIVTRYDSTSETQQVINLANRVGFLDKKLQVISQNCEASAEWLMWAKVAYQSSYGYEWQGDNLLIARENLLYTLTDFYEAKFKCKLSNDMIVEFAEIIAWNIFQMDGLKYVVPYTGHNKKELTSSEAASDTLTLFDLDTIATAPGSNKVDKICVECELYGKRTHKPKFVKIMDWEQGKTTQFRRLAR